jgi:spore coat protein CotH
MGVYVPATLKIDGQDLGRVGVRYKGAWGTFRTCLQGATGSTGGVVPARPQGGDGNGNGCTNQLPLKVAFDEIDPLKRWNGLKKVNLHSLIRDFTKMHEKLTFQIFRGMGIATARSTHARVTLTVGAASAVALYALTENVSDGRFTEDRWPRDQNGNLYKQGWPRFVTAAYWQPKLETNTDAVPPVTHDKVLAFSKEVYYGRANPETVLAALHKWSDVEWLARVMAVDTVSNNTDGLTKFWCRQPSSAAPLASDCSNNNYFWYQTKADKFLLVPWDVDYTWELRPDHYVIPAWDAAVADCTKPYPLYGADHMAPSCDPIFRALNLPAPRALYIQAIKDMLAGPLDVRRVHADIDRWTAALRPAIMATRSATLGAVEVRSAINLAFWEAQVRTWKGNVQTLRDRIAGVIDGRPFRP